MRTAATEVVVPLRSGIRRARAQAEYAIEPRSAVVTRFAALASLSAAERELLSNLPPCGQHGAGAELFFEGDAMIRPRLVVSGWAARVRFLADGRRQIFGFFLPGDTLGLCLRGRTAALCSGVALTPVELVDATELRAALLAGPAEYPGLSLAYDRTFAFEQAYQLDQISRIGRQTAYERLAHLLLELHSRLQLAGLSEGHRFPMPLTQEMLADALGLSIVHVNRTLQNLRRDDLIDIRSSQMTLLDPEFLASIADYRQPHILA
jgi:CRP-like cAMP-binding protein